MISLHARYRSAARSAAKEGIGVLACIKATQLQGIEVGSSTQRDIGLAAFEYAFQIDPQTVDALPLGVSFWIIDRIPSRDSMHIGKQK